MSAVDHWGPQSGDEKHLPVVFQCPAWQYLCDRNCVMVMHAHSLHLNLILNFNTAPAYHGRLKAVQQMSSSGSLWAPLLQSHASCMPSWACQSGMSSGSLRMSGSRPSSAMRCSSSGPSSKSCVDAGRYSSCENTGCLSNSFCAVLCGYTQPA